MRRLIDTNICIAYLNGSDKIVRDRVLACQPDEIVLCSIVRAELLYGARNSANVESNLEKVHAFLQIFDSYPFDDDAAERYGILRVQLQRSGDLIGANDLLIASIALSHDLILVTRNQREFGRVAGLRLEVW